MGCTSSKHIDPTPRYPPYSIYIPSESFPATSTRSATHLSERNGPSRRSGFYGGGSGGFPWKADGQIAAPRRYFHHSDEEVELELARIRAENGIWGRRW